ncbi:aminotransferase class III-fold pyridoxal phosphate-dependent enzyme [Rhizobium halophytocola]|uniref:4-aminobutyrate aminotransferase-like enzyme/Ser/Thr protein kinase RdoA (MazF antagonist) n=1 Tax=Rhizobium halophytocola TaxID=735519 RepID=A0ABS4E253_9HYPH|nr:aminotransferase class III-fold pyridoxal phosphate-dependent enzyme [Rhizobium halophytocola]MBP1852027.1 4-aminobutyrate aminotransferase-like enzyme/Ser/Thr protein kinase RdoA (MazF antagonist) [Rhizobium halophytocola]
MADQAQYRRIALPRPEISLETAAALLSDRFGRTGQLIELPGAQDRDFLVETDQDRFLLKISAADASEQEAMAQLATLRHLSESLPDLTLPQPVPATDGSALALHESEDGQYRIRLLRIADADTLAGSGALNAEDLRAAGAFAARISLALRDFTHPGLERELQWDLRRAGPVALELLAAVPDNTKRDKIAKAMITAVRHLRPLATDLRTQAIHQHLSDEAITASRDDKGLWRPDGILDFDDVAYGWLVGDLAILAASLLAHGGGDAFAILPAIEAFHAQLPLTDGELKALWPLIVARAGVLVASGEKQLALEPGNAPLRAQVGRHWQIFDAATSVPFSLMEHAILGRMGRVPAIRDLAAGRLLPDIEAGAYGLTDLSVSSPALVGDGFADPEIDWKLLAREAARTGVATTRYGEYRLSYTRLHSAREPTNCALHVDVCLPAATRAVAPFAGTIRHNEDRFILASDTLSLHVFGLDCPLEDGTVLEQGDDLGQVAGEEGTVGGLRLQLCRDHDLVPPLFARRSQAAAWQVLCPSPAALLDCPLDAAPLPAGGTPQFERGFGEYLFDLDGRAYLDMAGDANLVGHGDLRMAEAAYRQWAMINTGPAIQPQIIADYKASLEARAPRGLDHVFLVGSSSEATDLALRLARAHTGAEAVISASATSDSRVTTVAIPNSYRGPYRGEPSTADYVDAVQTELMRLQADDEPVAAFHCEATCSNAAGLALPPGYLAEVYDMIRSQGGVCIADEAMTGLGRLGHHAWGFEQQGVTPDIIVIGENLAGGQPLGAVVTTHAIAESLAKHEETVSSPSGLPVSCAVAMAVLDGLAQDGLQENARDVGDHLRSRLEALLHRFGPGSTVHGMGLHLGLELTRDEDTLEPAGEAAAMLCRRLLALGVIIRPTGDHLNILRITPPLCLTRESADFFIDMLESAASQAA